ncbi:MAG TPA: DUF1501 domain-containing protein [Deltaproteobacteria bacterium]|nr:DUF1501 domain-containing protein [Deltaproteobacteria bacterium]
MLSRREFLRSAAVAGALLPTMARAAASGDRKLVLLFANGGWDSTLCMDPRLNHPSIDGAELHEDPNNPDDREYLRTFGDNLEIVCNDLKRPSVSRYFERWGHETAVLNGIWLGSIAHPSCRGRVLTGTNSMLAPDLASIHGDALIGDKPLGTIDMAGMAMPGPLAASAGRTGTANQLKTLLDDDVVLPSPGAPYPLFVPAETDRVAVGRLLEQRARRLATLRGGTQANDERLDDYFLSMERAERFRAQSDGLLDGLQLGKIASLPTMAETAVDMLEHELCQSVFLDTNRAWDDHAALVSQHESYEATFAALTYLIDLLSERGLLSQTTVLVLSEMTRTPKINAELGKDHWPHASAIVIGAGVRGGHTYGATNDLMESVPMDLATGDPTELGTMLRYENFGASVLSLLGGDHERWFPGITPFTGWVR